MSPHNKILIGLALCLFMVAGIFGYVWPKISQERTAPATDAAFVPLRLPEDITAPFAADFADMRAALESKTLPSDTFKNIDGKDVSLADYAGKPTLVNFWATWCGPCVVELPTLELLKKHYEGRLNVVAIAVSETRDLAQLKDFLHGRQIGDFAGYREDGDVFMEKLSLRGLPTSFLIGSDGHILYRFEGDADWSSEASRKFFDAVILQKK